MMKACSKCGEIKSAEGFSRDRRARDGFQSQCKICARQYRQSDKVKQANRKYEQTEKGKQTRQQYRQSDKRKQSQQKYQQSEKYKQYQRQYNQSENGKQVKQQYRQSENGKQYHRKNGNIRRTRKTQAGGTYTSTEWYNLCEFYNFHCLRCNKKLLFEKLTLDHVKPISKGGTSFIWNTQPLCNRCNNSKGNKEIDYRQTLPDWINRDGPIWMQGSLF